MRLRLSQGSVGIECLLNPQASCRHKQNTIFLSLDKMLARIDQQLDYTLLVERLVKPIKMLAILLVY